jgi:HK97 family phage major capsid protein
MMVINMDGSAKLTMEQLDAKIDEKVALKVAPKEKEIEELKAKNEELEKKVETLETKEVKSNIPLVEEYKEMKWKDKGDISFNFNPPEYSDAWYKNLTPAQRNQIILRSLLKDNRDMYINTHMHSAITVDKSCKPTREYSLKERLEYARQVDMFKDMTEGSGTAGGVLVAPEYMQVLINLLYYNPKNLMNYFTKRFTTTGATITQPTLSASATVYPVAEGGTKYESDPTTGSLTWKVKKFVCMTDISEELLMDSDPSAAEMIQEAHVQALTLYQHFMFFFGNGTTQWRGIDLDIAAAETVFAGGVFNSDDLVDLHFALRPDYENEGWFYFNRCILQQIRKFQDLVGRYIWERNQNEHFTNLMPGQIDGYAYWQGMDDEIPLGSSQSGSGTGDYGRIYFGRPSNYNIYVRTPFIVKYNGFFDPDKNIGRFYTETRSDGRMIPHAFSRLEGVSC